MKIDVTRRDLLKFAGGAAAGVMLTPAPWKAIDDLAIWTQNWSWIPVPPKGPVTKRATVCSLCPAGCPVEARCVGGLPVSLRRLGAADAGALCTLGLTGHHLAYHPARLTAPARILHGSEGSRRVPVPLDTVMGAIVREIGAAGVDRRVAVLDMRPGRSVSWAWRRLLDSIPGGVLIPSPAREGSSLNALEAMKGSGSYGIDPGNARTILSFGAPLAEGWGAPESTYRLLGGAQRDLRLIQVEPLLSRTAQAADLWLPARPGTETALALGLGHLLLRGQAGAGAGAADLEAYSALTERFTPEAVAALTGVPAALLVHAARKLIENGPSLVIAGDDAGTGRLGRVCETAIMGLNLLLGDAGRSGGVVARAALPAPFETGSLAPEVELDRIDDRSIGLLLIDASEGDLPMPWRVMQRKLAEKAVIVAISPYLAGTTERADYVIPSAAYLETIHEMPTPFDSPVASIRLSAPLIEPRVAAVDAGEFVRRIAAAAQIDLPEEWESSEWLMKARVSRIHESGVGNVTTPADGAVQNVSELSSADGLWDALLAGGHWQSEREEPAASPYLLLGGIAESRWLAATSDRAAQLTAVFHVPRDVSASAAVSPVVTKIYQESGLREAERVAVNPVTAQALGLKRGSRAKLVTAAAEMGVSLVTDDAVMPGVIDVQPGPTATALGVKRKGEQHGLFDLFAADEEGAWRSMNATLVEV
ncbi:MAG TPA: molybdopterin-dependent oxidoreductase [Thermoanaerobaculia bacterium]